MKPEKRNLIFIFDLKKYIHLLEKTDEFLTASEKEKAKEFISPLNEYKLLSQIIRRLILSFFLDCPPQEITYKYQEKGKPILDNDNLFFNISHSKNYMAMALSINNDIGIDIEALAYIPKLNSFLNTYLNPEEKAKFKKEFSNNKEYYAYTYWTMKEAYLKGRALGLDFDMKRISLVNASNLQQDSLMFACKVDGVLDKKSYTTILKINDEKELMCAVSLRSNEAFNIGQNQIIQFLNPQLSKAYIFTKLNKNVEE